MRHYDTCCVSQGEEVFVKQKTAASHKMAQLRGLSSYCAPVVVQPDQEDVAAVGRADKLVSLLPIIGEIGSEGEVEG